MPRRALFLAAAAVAVTAAGAYLPTLGGQFVYDDVSQLVIDDYIHQPAHVWDVLTFRVMGLDVLDRNRPAMLLSLMIDSLFWGRNAFGYHLTNILLHVACSLLVLTVLVLALRRLALRQAGPTRPLLGALAGAMLFAVHPLTSEAVCPVSFREDMLVAFFSLAALLLADGFPSRRLWKSLLLGAGCTLATLGAVASKESGSAVPALLVAYLLLIRGREHGRAFAILTAAGLAVVGLFVVARFSLTPAHSVVSFGAVRMGGSIAGTLKIQPRIWAFQLMEVFHPGLLCADQTVNYSIEWIDLGVALAVLAASAAAVVLLSIRNRGVALGACVWCLAILPVSNVLPMYRPIADRYLYLPMAGAAMAAGALVWRMRLPAGRARQAALAAGGIALLAVLSFFTVQRERVWHDSLSLWSDTVERNPKSFTAHTNLGFALFHAGAYDQAAGSFISAFRYGSQGEPWAGLAIAWDAMGRPELAEKAAAESIRREERYADPAGLVRSLRWLPDEAARLQAVLDRMNRKPSTVPKGG